MTRWLVVYAVRLLAALVLLSGAAILVGQRQSPSEWVTLLHLNDCELPCWIGIEPGKTTFAEAQRRIVDAYEDTSLYEVSTLNYDHYRITYKPKGYRLEILLDLYGGERSLQTSVHSITLLFQPGLPTVAELYDHLGALEFVEYLSFEDLKQELYFRNQRIKVSVDVLDCGNVIPTQRVREVDLWGSGLGIYAPIKWHGFWQCYS